MAFAVPVRTPSVVLATYRTEEASAAGGNRLLTQLLAGLRRDGLVRELTLQLMRRRCERGHGCWHGVLVVVVMVFAA